MPTHTPVPPASLSLASPSGDLPPAGSVQVDSVQTGSAQSGPFQGGRPGAATCPPRLVIVHPEHVIADAIAARLLTRLLDMQSVRRPVHLALTGGSLGIELLAAAARSPLLDAVDWTGVHLWWSDERYLPAGDGDRNEVQAREALIDLLTSQQGLPVTHVHTVTGPDASADVDQAAQLYADALAGVTMDITLLGMGPDGHVASLFPGQPALEVSGVATVAVTQSPKPPAQRVSFTFDSINASREVWLVVSGAGKAGPVAAALAGAPIKEVPAAGVHGTDRTLWLLDTAAADAP